MASQANTPQTSNKCPRCGRTFSSVQELLEHEKTCKPSAKSTGAPTKNDKTQTDMVVEDRFEATDN